MNIFDRLLHTCRIGNKYRLENANLEKDYIIYEITDINYGYIHYKQHFRNYPSTEHRDKYNSFLMDKVLING
jgi:hypothetical protein